MRTSVPVLMEIQMLNKDLIDHRHSPRQRIMTMEIRHFRVIFRMVKFSCRAAYIRLHEKSSSIRHEIRNRSKLFSGIPSKMLSPYVIIWSDDNDTSVIW